MEIVTDRDFWLFLHWFVGGLFGLFLIGFSLECWMNRPLVTERSPP
jgi:hypothetical protein